MVPSRAAPGSSASPGTAAAARPPWPAPRVERTVGNALILEGIGIFHPILLPFLDHTIWLDVDLDTALAQGIARAQSLGQSEEHAWREVWAPNERDFDKRFTPRDRADHIVMPG